MISIRNSEDRGAFDHGWLNTKHTFSFADYREPRQMGFRTLRVINEDRIAPGEGFGTHPHRDMEIITYIVSGALEHRDSLGSGGILRRGDVQVMSAGTGLTHSEFNPSQEETGHLLQIWIFPAQRGTTPGYDQKHFSDGQKHNRLEAIASGRAITGALPIGQDATVYAMLLDKGRGVTHPLETGRAAWVQVISGELDLGGVPLSPGDGAAIEDVPGIEISARSDCEVLLFDLA